MIKSDPALSPTLICQGDTAIFTASSSCISAGPSTLQAQCSFKGLRLLKALSWFSALDKLSYWDKSEAGGKASFLVWACFGLSVIVSTCSRMVELAKAWPHTCC